jgi:hypothetical protein
MIRWHTIYLSIGEGERGNSNAKKVMEERKKERKKEVSVSDIVRIIHCH